MTAYSRRGFRVRLVLENYNDYMRKCFLFVNILREKYVRNVIHKIWHFFYKELCSSSDDLCLDIDGFFIPPGESTLVLKENDKISVRIRPQSAAGAAAPSAAAGAVRSTVAPLTAAPGTLVESVALVLRRLQDGGGPDDSERSERDRLSKVAEMMAAESGSTDVSTDEEGVRDLASQLTSRQEVVRLSQKMADQATPPPPCAAKKHNLDSEQLSLTEISRELRRRYEATRQPQPTSSSTPAASATAISTSSAAATAFHTTPTATSTVSATGAATTTTTTTTIAAAAAAAAAVPAAVPSASAASPAPSMTSLDSPTSLIEMAMMLEASAETRGTSAEAPEASVETPGTPRKVETSTPFVTPSLAARPKPAEVGGVKGSAHGRGGWAVEAMHGAEAGVGGRAVGRQVEGTALSGQNVAEAKAMSRDIRQDGASGEVGRPRAVPGPARPIVVRPDDEQERSESRSAPRKVLMVGRHGRLWPASAPQKVKVLDEQGSLRSDPAPRKVIVVSKEDAMKWAQSKADSEGKQFVKATGHTAPLKALNEEREGPAKEQTQAVGRKAQIIAVKAPVLAKEEATPVKSQGKPNSSRQSQNMSEGKRGHVPASGVKRVRSSSSESSSESDSSSSEEDAPIKSTPARKSPTTPNTSAAVGDGASTEKKKKTRTRRRRGKKRRTPETPLPPPPPPPPPPQPRSADYAQRHGLPRGEIDRYKRAASVGIGWQTRPKNRRVVFDDDGNAVPAGAEPSPAAGVGRGGALAEGRSQWAWSQGRRDAQGTDSGRLMRGGWPRPESETMSVNDRSSSTVKTGDQSGSASTTADDSGSVLTSADHTRNQTPAEPCTATATVSPKDSRPGTQTSTAANTSVTSETLPHNTPSMRPAMGTTTTLSRNWDSGPSAHVSGWNSARGDGDTSWATGSTLGSGGGRRGSSLGAGLLPRAFMRPRRCVDPPRRSEVLGKPSAEKMTSQATSEGTRASKEKDVASSEGSDKLLQPDYLLASRAVNAAASAIAGTERDAKGTEVDTGDDSSVAENPHQGSRSGDSAASSEPNRLTTSSSRAQESNRRQTPYPAKSSTVTPASVTVTPRTSGYVPASSPPPPPPATASSSNPALDSSTVSASTAVPSTAPAPDASTTAPVSHTTVVLDGSGRPAEESVARDLRQLATSAERRPLVVARRDRPLPGRAPYREVTRHRGTPTQRLDAGKGASVSAASGASEDSNTGTGSNSGTPKVRREETRDSNGDESLSGLRDHGCHRGELDTTAAGTTGDYPEDTDVASSPSGDVYHNVSVILAGPPLETLSPRVEDSGESAEETDDSQDSANSGEESDGAEESDGRQDSWEMECLDELASDARLADVSVDSITNCNVVNAVGQNRRLEKQRARGLPPGGGKENQAPTEGVKDDKFYSQFPSMREVARKGDLIAFKCWDMAADYTPYVSNYREASVMEVAEERQGMARLTLQLLEYRPRGRRRGRFEITDPDDDEIVDLEEESGIEERAWGELIQPRLLHP